MSTSDLGPKVRRIDAPAVLARILVTTGLVFGASLWASALLIAFAIAFFSPWQGIAVAIIATLTLVGLRPVQSPQNDSSGRPLWSPAKRAVPRPVPTMGPLVFS